MIAWFIVQDHVPYCGDRREYDRIMKRIKQSIYDYRHRLQLTLLGEDIYEIMGELGIERDPLVSMNRYRLLQHWNDGIEQMILRKINERLHPNG